MQSAPKNASGMEHGFEISPDWDYTRKPIGDETEFDFLSDERCPGYSVRISGWRLRPVSAPDDQSGYDPLRDLLELEKALGKDVFLPFFLAIYAAHKTINCPPPLTGVVAAMGECPVKTAMQKEVQDKAISVAIENNIRVFYEITFSEPVAFLALPFFTLTVRHKTRYTIEKMPWPFGNPPRTLLHLAKSGFSSCHTCIIAQPPSGDAVWAVRQFTPCVVETTWNRKRAVETEFPWIKNLHNGLGAIIEAIQTSSSKSESSQKEIVTRLDRQEKNVFALTDDASRAWQRPMEVAEEIIRRCNLNADDVKTKQTYEQCGTEEKAAKELGISRPMFHRRLKVVRDKYAKAKVPWQRASRLPEQSRRDNIEDYPDTRHD